ncbi:uncharacterized protein LAESUDRAFT_764729 [Laetiporus sulphureus 93-53]|uniref:Uncharacterized protein n=1 Tax=Laetiporus sulphureus 93-53 TaxID=1314785 RepID=A0A165B5U9_9APHY|nr:uncharacterized protein LAESUDRAFT_764729 [Laetiporus sulphureus 93-53]KZT00306.1 hypothetical protein LAESUDRAFT_764729 [Laetiporus sulphureus 93-53]
MSHTDSVFSLAARTRGVYPIDSACILLLQCLDNLVFASPTPDAHALIWQGWATSFSTYELRMTCDYPDHAKSLLCEVNSVHDWLMLNASPNFDWIPAMVPSTLRGYFEAVSTADPIRSSAAMAEIMREIIEAADCGNFDKFPEGRDLTDDRFLMAFTANDVFVDWCDCTFLGQTIPIGCWWIDYDSRHIPSSSTMSHAMAEILQDVVKHESEVAAVTLRVQSRSASVVSTVSSAVTTKSSESNMLHEYYATIHTLPKHVKIMFLSFRKPWPHTKCSKCLMDDDCMIMPSEHGAKSLVDTEQILSEIHGLDVPSALLVEIYTHERA